MKLPVAQIRGRKLISNSQQYFNRKPWHKNLWCLVSQGREGERANWAFPHHHLLPRLSCAYTEARKLPAPMPTTSPATHVLKNHSVTHICEAQRYLCARVKTHIHVFTQVCTQVPRKKHAYIPKHTHKEPHGNLCLYAKSRRVQNGTGAGGWVHINRPL